MDKQPPIQLGPSIFGELERPGEGHGAQEFGLCALVHAESPVFIFPFLPS